MPTAASRIASQLDQSTRVALQSFFSLTIPVTPELEELERLGLVVRDPTFAFRYGDTKLMTWHVLPMGRAVVYELVQRLQEDQGTAPASGVDVSARAIEALLVTVAQMGGFLESLRSTGLGAGADAVLRGPRVVEGTREARRVLAQTPGLGYPRACPSCGSEDVVVADYTWCCQACNYSRGLGDLPVDTDDTP
jgi:hypothetical protein